MRRILHSHIEVDVNIKETFLSQNQHITVTRQGYGFARYDAGPGNTRPRVRRQTKLLAQLVG
jgi:hypothetical protein